MPSIRFWTYIYIARKVNIIKMRQNNTILSTNDITLYRKFRRIFKKYKELHKRNNNKIMEEKKWIEEEGTK